MAACALADPILAVYSNVSCHSNISCHSITGIFALKRSLMGFQDRSRIILPSAGFDWPLDDPINPKRRLQS